MAWPKGKPRGPKPPTSGRRKGTPNKSTATIKDLAQKHGPAMIEALRQIADDQKHPARVAAIRELLDRGYGKPSQAHTDQDGEPIQLLGIVARPVIGTAEDWARETAKYQKILTHGSAAEPSSGAANGKDGDP